MKRYKQDGDVMSEDLNGMWVRWDTVEAMLEEYEHACHIYEKMIQNAMEAKKRKAIRR